MQDILTSSKAKNFSDLALLAMQHDRRAFPNTLSAVPLLEEALALATAIQHIGETA